LGWLPLLWTLWVSRLVWKMTRLWQQFRWQQGGGIRRKEICDELGCVSLVLAPPVPPGPPLSSSSSLHLRKPSFVSALQRFGPASGQQLQINITDRNGLTALGCACLFGHLDCLELIARSYPESLSFSYRYHDFESVPESVLRNMVNLASTEDRQETLRCLAYLITRGCPLTEKLIRRLEL
jgi:hypothetical protein